MGLDMYAFMRMEKLPAQVDFNEMPADCQLHYWRKHPNLHGWMEDLYREKGGSADSFNCVAVQLTAEDLHALEDAVRTGTLSETSGFFFGESDGSERDDDLDFIAKARRALTIGWYVFYTSWW